MTEDPTEFSVEEEPVMDAPDSAPSEPPPPDAPPQGAPAEPQPPDAPPDSASSEPPPPDAPPAAPVVPDWLQLGPQGAPQVPQVPPQAAQNSFTPQQIEELRNVVAALQDNKEDDLLAQVLQNPRAVFDAQLNPIQTRIQQLEQMLARQMAVNQATSQRKVKDAVVKAYTETFARDDHVAGNPAVKMEVDNLTRQFADAAVQRMMSGDPSHLEFMESPEFAKSVLFLVKQKFGIQDTPATAAPAPMPPSSAAVSQPSPGTAATAAPSLPPGIDERTLELARRMGITPEMIIETNKYEPLGD